MTEVADNDWAAWFEYKLKERERERDLDRYHEALRRRKAERAVEAEAIFARIST